MIALVSPPGTPPAVLIPTLRRGRTPVLVPNRCGWLDPIVVAAGLRPEAVHLYIVNDPSINAFVAEGQNIFLHTGLLMTLETPTQIMGVMAHETGHSCSLWHSGSHSNLMWPDPTRGNDAKRFQKNMLRSSRHVQYF